MMTGAAVVSSSARWPAALCSLVTYSGMELSPAADGLRNQNRRVRITDVPDRPSAR